MCGPRRIGRIRIVIGIKQAVSPCLLVALLGTVLLGCAAPAPTAQQANPSSVGAGSAIVRPSAAEAPEPPVGLEIGQRGPDFTIDYTDGRPLLAADLRAAGKPYLLYFFATW
jgi:hypothetical protein